MAVFKDVNEDGLIITCGCGCGDTVKMEFDIEGGYEYFFMAYAKSDWYNEQHGVFDRLVGKLHKIWRIIRNKDHHYSDIRMTRADFEVFKEYINSVR